MRTRHELRRDRYKKTSDGMTEQQWIYTLTPEEARLWANMRKHDRKLYHVPRYALEARVKGTVWALSPRPYPNRESMCWSELEDRLWYCTTPDGWVDYEMDICLNDVWPEDHLGVTQADISLNDVRSEDHLGVTQADMPALLEEYLTEMQRLPVRLNWRSEVVSLAELHLREYLFFAIEGDGIWWDPAEDRNRFCDWIQAKKKGCTPKSAC